MAAAGDTAARTASRLRTGRRGTVCRKLVLAGRLVSPHERRHRGSDVSGGARRRGPGGGRVRGDAGQGRLPAPGPEHVAVAGLGSGDEGHDDDRVLNLVAEYPE